MLKKYKKDLSTIWPLLLICLIVPLIVRLKVIPLSSSTKTIINSTEENYDLFSYYKMIWFLTFTAVLVLNSIFNLSNKKDLLIKKSKFYLPMAIYTLFAILSTLLSPNKDIAFLGFMDRYEGLFVLLAYMICLFLTINLVNDERQIKSILLAIALSTTIISLIGFSQFIGKDFFSSTIGKSLIIPPKFASSIETFNLVFADRNMVYSTLYNPNYVGMFMSMIFPISSTILLLSKEKQLKIFCSIISLLSFFTLLSSGSKTALISLFIYILLMILFFRSLLVKKWKYLILAFTISISLAFALNYYNNDMLIKRVKILKQSFETQDKGLKDIELKDNTAKISIDDYSFKILYKDDSFEFYDKAGREIEYILKDNKINFDLKPYNLHNIEIKKFQENYVLSTNIKLKNRHLEFNLVIDDNGDIKFLTPQLKIVDLNPAPSWGFKGREDFATARGYTWSRSIPLLKNTKLIGYGPDTFAINFPQDDYIALLKYMYHSELIIDKPHNYYLQTALNTGIVSLIALLTIFILYLVDSFKIFINKRTFSTFKEIAAIAIFFGILNFLIMSFFNDSSLSVSPIFWILLGSGISLNTSKKKLKD